MPLTFQKQRASSLWTLLATTSFAAAPFMGALAQDVQGSGAVTGLLPPASAASAKDSAALSLSRFDNATGQQSDVIIGRNIKGPYLLTWKGIRPGSEIVSRDGITLKPDADYTLDAASGALAFPTPLLPNQLIRISYRADQPDSTLNKKTFALPVQLDLWHAGTNRLAFQSVYQPDAPGAAKGDTSSLLSSLQFNGGYRLAKGSDLSSNLLVDLRGGDWLGRSGLRLAEHTKGKKGEFGLTYSRAGAKFAQQNADSLTAGREIMEATGSLLPASGLKLSGTLRQTTELRNTDNDKPQDHLGSIGAVTRELSQNLTYTLPRSKASLEANRLQTTVTQPDGSGTVRIQDSVKLQETIRKGTQASVTYDATSTTPFTEKKSDGAPADSKAAKGDYTQKTALEIKHNPGDPLQITGSFQNVVGGSAAGDSQAIKVEALPYPKLKQLKIIANWQDQYRSDGATRSREASLQLPMLPWWRLQTTGGVRQTSSPGKERLVGIVDAKSQPLRYLQVSGGARFRDGYAGAPGNPDPDAVNTYLMKVTLEPSKQFRLTGNLTRNPEADDGSIRKTQKQDVGLETKLGIFALKGQYGIEEEYLQSRQTNTLDLGLDLRLTTADTLSGGFQGRYLLDKDDTETRTFTLAYTHRIGSLFDLSLSGTMSRYSLNGVNAPDKEEIKAQAKLGLKF